MFKEYAGIMSILIQYAFLEDHLMLCRNTRGTEMLKGSGLMDK
jgi:hypothetical protein